MTKARAAIFCPREPLGLSLEEASRFVGISAGLFDRLVREGKMPFARLLAGRRVWDADEVAAAFRRLPYSVPANLPAALVAMHDDQVDDPYDRVRA